MHGADAVAVGFDRQRAMPAQHGHAAGGHVRRQQLVDRLHRDPRLVAQRADVALARVEPQLRPRARRSAAGGAGSSRGSPRASWRSSATPPGTRSRDIRRAARPAKSAGRRASRAPRPARRWRRAARPPALRPRRPARRRRRRCPPRCSACRSSGGSLGLDAELADRVAVALASRFRSACRSRLALPMPASTPRPCSRSLTSGSPSTALTSLFSRATTAGGVPAGARMPNQPVTSKPGMPCSATVGTSGSTLERALVVTASGPQLARLDVRQRARRNVEAEVDLAGQQRRERRAGALVRHHDHVDLRFALQELGRQAGGRRAAAAGGVVELARALARRVDHVLQAACRAPTPARR